MTASYVPGLIGLIEPRDDGPRAQKVLTTDTVNVVVFEFGEGHELSDHAARHPVLIAVLSGRATMTVGDDSFELAPGALIHLEPMVRHAVVAHEPTTLTVTMLLPH